MTLFWYCLYPFSCWKLTRTEVPQLVKEWNLWEDKAGISHLLSLFDIVMKAFYEVLSDHSFAFVSTAGRMIKTGLTASVIVSQWTWAATLLQSSNVAWAYGVSGPFW